MAKVSLARKKELNEPDAFIDKSNQVALFIQENKEKVFGAIAGVIIIVIAICGYIAYAKNHSDEAFAEFSKDLTWYEGTPDKPVTRSLDEVKERSDVFLKKYAGTVAGTLAKAKYAGIFYNEGLYKRSAELYEKLLRCKKRQCAKKYSAKRVGIFI